MTIWKESLLGRLLIAMYQVIANWYDESALKCGLDNVYSACGRTFDGSQVAQFFYRDGKLVQEWKNSWFVWLLTAIINLPTNVLHWIYNKLQPVLDDSFFAQIGFSLAEQTSVMVAWFMALIILFPYEHWNNMYSFTGFIFMTGMVCLGGMRKRSLRLDITNVGPYWMIYAGAVVLAYLVSYTSALSLRFTFYHISCMLCVLVVVSSVETAEQLRRLAGGVTLGLMGTAGYGVLQGLAGVEINYSYFDPLVNKDMPGRVFGMYENPNAFAQVLVLLIPFAVALLIGSKTMRGRMASALAAALGFVAIGMTYSRGAWVGLAVAACLFVFLWKRKLIPLFVIAAIAAVPLLPDSIFNRILTITDASDSSTASRFPLYEAALSILKTRPIRGVGLGSDVVRTAISDKNMYFGTSPFVHAHNLYLQVWLEMGILGLLAFIGAMVAGVKGVAKAIRMPNCPTDVKVIAIAGASALVGTLVAGVADYPWNYPRVMLIFWFVFGIMLASIKLAHRASKGEDIS